MRYDPIYYTADADTYCPACAEAIYEAVSNPLAEDREGNMVGAAAPWDDMPEDGVYCGECGGEVVPPTEEYLEDRRAEDREDEDADPAQLLLGE